MDKARNLSRTFEVAFIKYTFFLLLFIVSHAQAESSADFERKVASSIEAHEFEEAKKLLGEWKAAYPNDSKKIFDFTKSVEAVEGLDDLNSELKDLVDQAKRISKMPLKERLGNAVIQGDEVTVKKLLEEGADPNKASVAGSALGLAASKGHVDVMSLLLKEGADINGQDFIGKTALMYAAEKEQVDAVQLLVKSKADVNTENKHGETALNFAIKTGNKEITKIISEAGGFAGNQFKQWPLQRAKYSHENVNENLIEAVSGSDLKMVKTFLEKGADANYGGFIGGFTPLMIASQKGNLKVMKLLVKHGANVNHKSNDISAMFTAISQGQTKAVAYLIGKGANVNETGIIKTPVISTAVSKGNKEIVSLLISKGADVNATDILGGTALDAAIKGGDAEIVELLKSSGAKRSES